MQVEGAGAIIGYAVLFILPFGVEFKKERLQSAVDSLHLIGLGLLIHMGLDWVDCWW